MADRFLACAVIHNLGTIVLIIRGCIKVVETSLANAGVPACILAANMISN